MSDVFSCSNVDTVALPPTASVAVCIRWRCCCTSAALCVCLTILLFIYSPEFETKNTTRVEMSSEGGARKKGRDEPEPKSKARRIRDANEEARLLAEEEKERVLSAASEETLKRLKRQGRETGKAKAEDTDSDESWEDATDEEADDEDVDERFDEMVEEEIIDAADEEDEEGEGDDEEYAALQREANAEGMASAMKHVTFAEEPEEEEEGDGQAKVWRGDQDGNALSADQKLDFSNRAYDSFFQLRTEYPCLSFDVIHDSEGSSRTKYPLTMYFVCGSQADERNKNQLYILKVSNICRTKHDVESDEDSDEDNLIGDAGDSEDDDDAEEVNGGEPLVDFRTIKHAGTANRVRCSTHQKQLCAVWSDVGHVQVFSLAHDYAALADFANWSAEQARQFNKKDKSAANPLKYCTPASTHKTEGYGIDWSTVEPEVFASGDCGGDLFVWKPTEDGRWSSVASSTSGKNRNSIEEIKWSPIQSSVLLCGRAGGMVEVWDTRDMRRCQLTWRADAQDINVCDWNRAKQASHLLVTGADSGIVAVWDLRRAKEAEPQPIQKLLWHKKRITSVEFSLLNESVLAVTGDDNQCTLWDLSLERDASEEQQVVGELFERKDLVELPDQLMFQHQGLEHPKEVHWHNQVPGMVVTTDFNGLHLFKPMNWRSLMK